MLILFAYLICFTYAVICLNFSNKIGTFGTAVDLPLNSVQNPLFHNIIRPHVLVTYRSLCVGILLNAQEFFIHPLLSQVSFSVK
jgi:hypothetical protein